MGIDILHFMDHDLPMDDFHQFYKEFDNRVKGKAVVLEEYDRVGPNYEDFSTNNFPSLMWYLKRYSDSENMIHLTYDDGKLHYSFTICRKTVCIEPAEINGEFFFDSPRWNRMIDMFVDEPETGKKWINKKMDICRKYFIPIFHSKQILLTADSSSYRHETLAGDFLMEQGKTIDEALELNKSFSPPCKVWRNDEAFGREFEDYCDTGKDSIGALFLFDL